MKYKLIGELINEVDLKNINNEELKVLGIKKDKTFFPTIADLKDVDTSEYKIIQKNYFACNLIHVGRDAVLPIALHKESKRYLVSKAYKTFTVKENSEVTPEYLMIYFQNKEFDRYLWFISDVGIRGELKWERFLEIPIPIPNLNLQKEMSEMWINLKKNIEKIDRILTIKKHFISYYFSYIATNYKTKKLKEFIEIENFTNNEEIYQKSDVRGIAITKEFIKTKANLDNVNLKKYKIVNTNSFAYATNTSRMGDKLAIGLNKSTPILVSTIYPVFKINSSKLMEDYLLAWFKREEFDRYARFHSWGSAREIFSISDMENIDIPLPELSIQKHVSSLNKNIEKLLTLKESYKKIISNLSPVLKVGIVSKKL